MLQITANIFVLKYLFREEKSIPRLVFTETPEKTQKSQPHSCASSTPGEGTGHISHRLSSHFLCGQSFETLSLCFPILPHKCPSCSSEQCDIHRIHLGTVSTSTRTPHHREWGHRWRETHGRLGLCVRSTVLQQSPSLPFAVKHQIVLKLTKILHHDQMFPFLFLGEAEQGNSCYALIQLTVLEGIFILSFGNSQ